MDDKKSRTNIEFIEKQKIVQFEKIKQKKNQFPIKYYSKKKVLSQIQKT